MHTGNPLVDIGVCISMPYTFIYATPSIINLNNCYLSVELFLRDKDFID